jgi:Flp pilus assembly protein TadG
MTNTITSQYCKMRRTVMLLHHNTREELGQALVELALTLPILSVLVLGAAEFGRLAYDAIEVSNAARAGVAYGSQTIITAQNAAGMVAAATNDGADVIGLQPSGLAATASQFCTCSDGTAVTCANALSNCLSPAHILEFVQVNTTATVDPLFHVPGLPTTYALKGQAIMQVAQ